MTSLSDDPSRMAAERSPCFILNTHLPYMPWMEPGGMRLPGLRPIPPEAWLMETEVFDSQMAYRDELIRLHRSTVYQAHPDCTDGAYALLNMVLAHLSDHAGYVRDGPYITRPDKVRIDTDSDHPLIIAGRLVQEDFALLRSTEDGHSLVGGIICFPSHWSVQEKMNRSLASMHAPVPEFDKNLTRRTERIFNHLRDDQPLIRGNTLIYTNPDLHQPATEEMNKHLAPEEPHYVRVERQTLRRLPLSDMIVFGIHTSVLPINQLPAEALAQLIDLHPDMPAL